MQSECETIREILILAIHRRPYEGLLFSGGLDTAILAALHPKAVAITVALEGYAQDIPYAACVAKTFGMHQLIRNVSQEEALKAFPHVIRVLKSFDPALPNDLAVYFGLHKAKELGITRVATGDASDELFGGYSFMADIDDLDSYIQHIAKHMEFSAQPLGIFFGTEIVQPFTDQKVKDFALSLPRKLKIREENNMLFGKWILRKAFSDFLPQEIAWQGKRPLEYGSGMTQLRSVIRAQISDDEFQEKSRIYPVKFFNKEHLYFYEVYKKEVGDIPLPKSTEKACRGCGAGMAKEGFHCRVCGNIVLSSE